jgi:hypothetical protein
MVGEKLRQCLSGCIEYLTVLFDLSADQLKRGPLAEPRNGFGAVHFRLQSGDGPVVCRIEPTFAEGSFLRLLIKLDETLNSL